MISIIVISLILLGVFLILIEFFITPGVTVAGIGGLFFTVSGIVVAYSYLGNYAGSITLIASVLIIVLVLIIALKSKTWDKVMLKKSIDSTSPTFENETIQIGDKGITISRLAPIGKIFINDMYIEAKSISGFINQEEKVEVIQVLQNQVVVKSINN